MLTFILCKTWCNLFDRALTPAAFQSLKPFLGASFSDHSVHFLALKTVCVPLFLNV